MSANIKNGKAKKDVDDEDIKIPAYLKQFVGMNIKDKDNDEDEDDLDNKTNQQKAKDQE